MPNAIDARRRRDAEWIARLDDREERRDRLRDIPLHDRPHVKQMVIEIFEERRTR
ncbi:hypothetical protein [Guyparkeria sp. SB14A]|uniref:hypothetical protein n=1 Tax=Guyparkeria sp. SB14A TaxID=2571147 RepID=UPI00145CC3CE|nr:hypothetical protein [Guyparkeria sp. SB14A]